MNEDLPCRKIFDDFKLIKIKKFRFRLFSKRKHSQYYCSWSRLRFLLILIFNKLFLYSNETITGIIVNKNLPPT